MQIESKDFTIKTLLSRRQFTIPNYQRNYAWEVNDEIETFWDDFVYSMDDGYSFFIGPMVLQGDGINESKFQVIDGQQRLITITILISVLVSKFYEFNSDLGNGLKQYLIFPDEKMKNTLVVDTVEPHPYYQDKIFNFNNVTPTKDSEKKIESAFDFFTKKINGLVSMSKNEDEKKLLLEKIREAIFSITTVIIVSKDETDAFTIFETINTRGKNLSSLDLLKNYIFKNYPQRAGIREPQDTWKKISDNVKDSRDSFFNRFWASWITKVSEPILYKRFSDYIRSGKNLIFKDTTYLLDQLYKSSQIYRKIVKPEMSDWKENKLYWIYRKLININKQFNVKVHYAFLMSLFQEYEEGKIEVKDLGGILDSLEAFHFIFTYIVSARPSGMDQKYSKFAQKLRLEKNKRKVIGELRKELRDKIPSIEEFRENIKEVTYEKDKQLIIFCLLKLESRDNKNPDIFLENYSIEHLSAKSKKIDSYDNIGNLILLEKNINQKKLSFDLFDDKEKNLRWIDYFIRETKYKTSKKTLDKINKAGKWDSTSIEERTENIINQLYNYLVSTI